MGLLANRYSVLSKAKSAIPPLLKGSEVLFFASDKERLFAEKFSKNSNFDVSSTSLPVFSSRTSLKRHNISVTPKMVKRVITNLDSSKESGPDCIRVVFLKNCEFELLCVLAELFNMCLKESCFPYCWKVSLVVPAFKNVGERSTAKYYHPVSLLSVVSKVFEKFVNNRIVDHLEKCDFFLIFSMVLGLLDLRFDLLTVVSDRIGKAPSRSGATRAAALLYPRLLTGILTENLKVNDGASLFLRIPENPIRAHTLECIIYAPDLPVLREILMVRSAYYVRKRFTQEG